MDDEFDFAVDWICKDLSIVFTEGKKNAAQLSLTVLVEPHTVLPEGQGHLGGGHWDTSSLIRRLTRVQATAGYGASAAPPPS